MAVTGVAGVGKSVLAQRLLHEWALGAAFRSFLCALDFAAHDLAREPRPVVLKGFMGSQHPHVASIPPALLARPGPATSW